MNRPRQAPPHNPISWHVAIPLIAACLWLSACSGAAPEPRATATPATGSPSLQPIPTRINPTPTRPAPTTPAATERPPYTPIPTATRWTPQTPTAMAAISDGVATDITLPGDLQVLARGNFDRISPAAVLRFDTGDPQTMALAASQDGNLLAAQTVKGDVRVWDLEAARLARSFHTRSVAASSLETPCLAFSTDGLFMAAAVSSGRSDNGIGVWSLDGRDTPVFRSPALAGIRAAFLSAHGERLAVIAAYGRSVHVYDVRSGEQLAVQINSRGDVIRSANGMTLAGRTAEGAWALPWAEGKVEFEVAGSWEHADLSGDGSLLAVMDSEGTLAVYDVTSGVERWRLSSAMGPAKAMALSPDERFVAAVFPADLPFYYDHKVIVRRASDGQEVSATPTELGNGRIVLRFSPDGRILAAAKSDRMRLIEIATGDVSYIYGEELIEQGEFEEISFASDSALFFTQAQGHIRGAWDALAVDQLYTPRGARLPLLFGGRLLATVSQGAIHLWGDSTYPLTLPSADDFQTLTTHDTRRIELVGRVRIEGGTDLAYSPDDAWLAVGHKDGSLTLFDMTAQKRESWSGHDDWVFHVAFSPIGGRFATASKDGTLKVWDVANRRPVLDFSVAPGEVTALAYSPDGSLLAMAGTDKAIGLLNAATARVQRVLRGHTSRVTDLAFSPDGRLLGSISEDQTIRLWDVDTGELDWTGEFPGNDLGMQLAFSPDGTLLATDEYVWLVPEGDRRRIEPVDDLRMDLSGWGDWLPVLFWPDGMYMSRPGLGVSNPPRAAATWGNLSHLLPLPDFRAATFSHDGKLLAALSDEGWLCFLGVWR